MFTSLGEISFQPVFAWQGRSETPRIKTRHQYRELLSSFSKTLSPSCLVLLSQAPTPGRVLALGEEKLTTLLHKASGGKLGTVRAKEIMNKAAVSVGVTSQAPEEVIALLLEQINLIDSQLRTLNHRITELYEQAGLYFTSISGVGTLTAATILGEFGSVKLVYPGKADGCLCRYRSQVTLFRPASRPGTHIQTWFSLPAPGIVLVLSKCCSQ